MAEAALLARRYFHFGLIDGSPPELPGGGMTGVRAPVSGDLAVMSGSTSSRGRITPSSRSNFLWLISPLARRSSGGATFSGICAGGFSGMGEDGGVCALASITIPPNKAKIAAATHSTLRPWNLPRAVVIMSNSAQAVTLALQSWEPQ